MHKSQMGEVVFELIGTIDRSGSMYGTKTAAENGWNGFVAEQRAQPGVCFASLYQFDDKYETVYEGRPIADVPPYSLEPRGWTALFDAMGKTLRTALTNITDPARKVVLVFVTDGGENRSVEFLKIEQVQPLVTQARSRGWQIVFIGATEESLKTAQMAGIPMGSTLAYAANAAGTQAAYGSVSNNMTKLRSGQTPTMDFCESDRAEQAKAGAIQQP
jgi:hypothetical protein